ncbi:acetyltransferase [Actinoplanes sp. Pm04-4]|uniref:Acetyltransferase n=1 Tax=Paractinoplanes pyxinae TaxID=2997416 RepID=A0ABT4B3J9_9ACTN|nr:acetyltransferase [Actinoplanes pyxinae]MCY1141061.1 acetyltransferase [Actinoplanes pyxinae]
MSALLFRPLTAGETVEFDSVPGVPQMSYAEGLAGGGFHPSRTWIALRDGEVVARAAWVLPPGAVGGPWLERFDLHDSPSVGGELLTAAHDTLGGRWPYHAALPVGWRSSPDAFEAAFAAAELAGLSRRVERLRFSRTTDGARTPAADLPPQGPAAVSGSPVRPAAGPDEIRSLVARVPSPDVLTGSETARSVLGIDLATDPLPWLTGEATAWLVTDGGLVGTAGEACWPMIGYLGASDAPARRALLAEAVRVLLAGGAEQIVADVDADRTDVISDLLAAGFRPVRARLTFEA